MDFAEWKMLYFDEKIYEGPIVNIGSSLIQVMA